MEREVRHGCEQGKEQGRQDVGEHDGPQLGGSAEEGNEHEGSGVQGRNRPERADTFGLGYPARVADFSGARQVDQVDEGEPAGQEQAKNRPQQSGRTTGRRSDHEEERNGE